MGYSNDSGSVVVTIAGAKGLVNGRPFGRVSIIEFGGVEGGVVDNTAALLNAMTALGATGGIIEFGPGTWLINGQLTFPDNQAASNPTQPTIRLTGAGASHSGRGTAPLGGTILDMRFSGTYGKIVTLGLGYLEIDHMTLADYGTDSTPFVYSTYTTLHIHNCEFYGTKAGTLADQDAIILGGTTEVEGPRGYDVGFQGYGTVIKDNYFNRVRRSVYGRTFANNVVVQNNTVWNSCGSNLPGGTAIEFDNPAASPTQYTTGNVITGNLIEIANYPYGIKLLRTLNCSVLSNSMYDDSATTIAGVYFGARALYNFVVIGYSSGNKAFKDDSTDGTNVIHSPLDGYLIGGRNTLGLNFAPPGASHSLQMFQGYSTQWDGYFQIQMDKTTYLGGISTAGKKFQWGGTPGTPKFWVDATGAVSVDSLVLKNGPQLYTGTGSPEGVLTGPTGSLYLNQSGGAGTTLYVKESGVGNTGWIAK